MTQRDTVIADFQRSRTGAIRVRFYMVVGIFLFMLFAALIVAAWPVITVVAFWLAIGLGVAIGLSAIIGFCALVFIFYQWTKRERAKTRKMELDSRLIYSANNEAWFYEQIRLLDGTISEELARLGGTRLRVNGHDHDPTPAELLYANTLMTTGQSKMLEAGKIVPQKPNYVDLLSMLDRAERVLIKGASDAGKTTLLQHIAQRSKNVTIIDPHYTPGIWPTDKIIGAGRDYTSIEDFLIGLVDEVNNRYKRRASGDTSFEPMTVIIDEFNSIKEETKAGGKILGMLIRESRKVGFRLFIGSHSELVKPLGLEGQGDIREGLFIVRLEIDQITKQRRATIDAGNGEQECYIPPYGNENNDNVIVPDLVLQSGSSSIDDRISAMILDGASNQEIAQEIWEKPNLSGDNFYKVKSLREELSI
jgi:hypothetical protein